MFANVHFSFETEKEFAVFAAKFLWPQAAPTPTTESVAEKPKATKLASVKTEAPKVVEAPKTTKAEPADENLIATERGMEEIEDIDPTYDNVKNLILKVSSTLGRDAAVSVLAKYNYKKVDATMKSDDYAGVIRTCQETLMTAPQKAA